MTEFTFATFATFATDSENREACDICLAVANLQPVKPQPLILLGGSGSGKTHLLCAMVNHVRRHAPRTALAYITAKDFPSAVRALIKDASPVTRARAAILLVDQFEKFSPDLLDLLKEIAPLFLEENRYLVIAGQKNPQDMPQLPQSLKKAIRFGRVLQLTRPETRGAAPVEDFQQQVLELKSDNERLERELGAVREQLVEVEAERDRLPQDVPELEEALGANRVLEMEVRSLQRALEETRKQRDACQADAASLGSAKAEISRLRKQLSAGAPERGGPTADRTRVLEDELEQARAVARDAQDEMRRWTLKAQTLLQQVELIRARFAQTEEAQQQRVIELRQRLEALICGAAVAGGGSEMVDGAAQIERELAGIAEAAAGGSPADPDSRMRALYAKLMDAARAIQGLSDRIEHESGRAGSGAPRPWYADPFPLPRDEDTP